MQGALFILSRFYIKLVTVKSMYFTSPFLQRFMAWISCVQFLSKYCKNQFFVKILSNKRLLKNDFWEITFLGLEMCSWKYPDDSTRNNTKNYAIFSLKHCIGFLLLFRNYVMIIKALQLSYHELILCNTLWFFQFTSLMEPLMSKNQ